MSTNSTLFLYFVLQCLLVSLNVVEGGILLINPTQQTGAAGAGPAGTKLMPTNCDQLTEINNLENDERLLLCQLYESTSLLTQLGQLVSQGLDRLMLNQGIIPTIPTNGQSEYAEESLAPTREKKKHEYLRFGKRKHEYLRFGKRKHEYLRFG